MGAGSGAAVASCATAVSTGPQMVDVASTIASVLEIPLIAPGSRTAPTIWEISEVGTLNCSSALTNSASLMLALGVPGVVTESEETALSSIMPASIAGTNDGPSPTVGTKSDARTLGSPVGAVVSTPVDAVIAAGDGSEVTAGLVPVSAATVVIIDPVTASSAESATALV